MVLVIGVSVVPGRLLLWAVGATMSSYDPKKDPGLSSYGALIGIALILTFFGWCLAHG